MIDKLNSILLIILLILIIFCIGVYIYTDANISNIVSIDQFDNITDDKSYLLELMSEANENATKILKERFGISTTIAIDTRQILKKDAENYYNSINAVQYWLDNNYNGEYGIIARIKADIETAQNIRKVNKKALLNLLTNVYIISYLNYTNKQNAESYKMYLKYNDPQKNKYYTQYLK